MKATLTISDNIITPPIRPYPDGDIVPTKLHTANLHSPHGESDFYQFQQGQGRLHEAILSLEMFYKQKQILLPDSISEKILEYLKNPKYGIDFDCHRFISHVTGKSLNYMLVDGDTKNISPGDIGLIMNKDQAIVHRQLYLGDDLFLSKGGRLGPLIVSTAEEMIKLRGGEKLHIQTNS